MNCRIKKLKHDVWLDEAKQFNDYSYTHYLAYSLKAAERIGAESEHIAVVSEKDKVIAVSNVRIKNLPFGLGGIAYIRGGPMVDRGQQEVEIALKSALTAIKNEYVNNRGLVLRIPQRHKVSSRRVKEASVYHQAGFVEHGITNATMLIDLSTKLEIIRKNFHPKWRNHLNKSERQGIKIVAGDDLILFDDFAKLFKELVARKGFDVDMDDCFFTTVQKHSPVQEKFHMAIAYIDDEPVGGLLLNMSSDTSVSLLRATNDIGRKFSAAYLLQWYAINESKRQDCRWYDLGGVDKKENPHVYHFKERMGGEETEVGSIFQVSHGLKGFLTLWSEKVFRIFI